MDVSLTIEGQDGLNWPRWKGLADAAERLGFAGLFRSDHFINAEGPLLDALDLWTSQAWLAASTRRIAFGPMVAPVSFNHPVNVAWTAAAIDDLSGGRMRLGLGAGWQEREHEMFGFDLLDVDRRFARFREGLEVVTRLLRSDEPVTFDGEFYRLREALLLPRPQRPGGPPIVVGGNGVRRTLPLATRYADEWNAVYQTADGFARRNDELTALLTDAGRDPTSVRRTLMTRVVFGRTPEEVAAKLDGQDADALREHGVLVGTGPDLREALRALAAAGVQGVLLQWLDGLDDVDAIAAMAKEILPAA